MIKPYKSLEVNGTPLEYIATTTEALQLGQALKQGSTMGGSVGAMTGSTAIPQFISMKASTGDTNPKPVFRVTDQVEFIINNASSVSAVSTTQVGLHFALSSSQSALDTGTTGFFKVSGVFNTSGAQAQYFTGFFTEYGTTL